MPKKLCHSGWRCDTRFQNPDNNSLHLQNYTSYIAIFYWIYWYHYSHVPFTLLPFSRSGGPTTRPGCRGRFSNRNRRMEGRAMEGGARDESHPVFNIRGRDVWLKFDIIGDISLPLSLKVNWYQWHLPAVLILALCHVLWPWFSSSHGVIVLQIDHPIQFIGWAPLCIHIVYSIGCYSYLRWMPSSVRVNDCLCTCI